jgi:hypothetical protein
MTLDTLIFLIAIAAFLYANLIRPAIRRRREAALRGPGVATSPAPDDADAIGTEQPAYEAWGREIQPPRPDAASTRPTRASRGSGPAATSPSDSTAALLRARLSNGSELRQAIVLMTVLGPCRALDTTELGEQPPAHGAPSGPRPAQPASPG